MKILQPLGKSWTVTCSEFWLTSVLTAVAGTHLSCVPGVAGTQLAGTRAKRIPFSTPGEYLFWLLNLIREVQTKSLEVLVNWISFHCCKTLPLWMKRLPGIYIPSVIAPLHFNFSPFRNQILKTKTIKSNQIYEENEKVTTVPRERCRFRKDLKGP